MKRWSAVLLALLMLLSVAACGVPDGAGTGGTPDVVFSELPAGPSAPAADGDQAPPEDSSPAADAPGEDAPAVEAPPEDGTVAAQESDALPEGSAAPGQESDVLPEESVDPEQGSDALPEDGTYTTKEDVALYLHLYGHLPENFITKREAQDLGWPGGSLEPYAPGKCIGGSRFGNYEGLLPEAKGRTYTECDIDTLGANSRGAKRIVFSNDGLIFYTEDHYESFELLYGEVDE